MLGIYQGLGVGVQGVGLRVLDSRVQSVGSLLLRIVGSGFSGFGSN